MCVCARAHPHPHPHTVVAFSLTTKQWGHVLVDGLVELCPNCDAWNQLVLPPKTKEILLAMAESTQQSTQPRADAASTVPRYRFRDVVDSKGTGVVFLLYGPPGTGKTLAVEALAASFGRPLYVLSFGELGASVAELEERLQDVLALAAHWSYHASRACLALKFYTDSVRLCRDPLACVRF